MQLKSENILLIEGRRTIGGGQIMSYRIAKILSKYYNLSILIPDGKCAIRDLFKDFPIYSYPMYEYRKGKKNICDIFKFVTNIFAGYRRIKGLVVNEKIGLLYVQAPSLIPLAALVASLAKIKVIVHLHVVHLDKKTRLMLNWCLRLNCVKRIIGVSNYTLEQLSQNNRKKGVILYNCIDSEEEQVKELTNDRKPVVAIIGDVMKTKGHHVLFEALDKLECDLEVLVVGRIVEEEYYEELVKSPHQFSYNFVGYVNNVSEYLNNIDLTVIPSVSSETFSLSMVESWSKGVPTIASRLGGMEELVMSLLPQHADTMLFTPNNSNELEKRISMLLFNKKLYSEISHDVSSVVASHFTEDIFEYKLVKILQSV